MSTPSPILVTACQRGGNTWAAKMLACAEGTRFLYQPFNGDAPRPITNLTWPFLDRKFTYVHAGNESRYYSATRALLRPRIPLEWPFLEGFRIAKARSASPTRRRFKDDLMPVVRARLRRSTPVIAGPGGLFLAEWIADRFGGRVVCLHRHPAGIAAGYKRMQWTRCMADVLEQEELMADLLWEHRDALRDWNLKFERGVRDWLGQAILWWKLTESAFFRYHERRPDFRFLHYEALAGSPQESFRSLYRDLGLTWSREAAERIDAHTGSGGDERLGSSMHVLQRNSRHVATSWLQRLSPNEIQRVRSETSPWAERYGLTLDYPGDD